MSVSNVNSFAPLSFSQRPNKQSVSQTADLTASGDALLSVGEGGVAEQVSTVAAPSIHSNTASANQPHVRDADDKIIAAWFKLMKPHRDGDSTFPHTHQKEDDPGRLPDPLYEPTKDKVPDSLKIITFNDLMRALAPKKPHWKHYDDVSNQYQVGSQERD
mgnify:CR=1 FL=1